MANPVSQPASVVERAFAPTSNAKPSTARASRCRCRRPHAGHEPRNSVTSTNKTSLVEDPRDDSIATILQPPISKTTLSTPPSTQPAPLSDTPRKQSSINEPVGTPQNRRKEKVGVEIKALREELCPHCFLSSFVPAFDDGEYGEKVASLPLLKADGFKLSSPSLTSSSRETWPVDSNEKAHYSHFTHLLNEIIDHFKEIIPHDSKPARFVIYDEPTAPLTSTSLKPDLWLVDEKFADLYPLQWKHPILPIEVKSDFWDALKQIGIYVREMLNARPGRQICWAIYFHHLESASRVILFTPDRVHYTQPMVITSAAGYRDMVKVVVALLSQPNLLTIGEDQSRDSLTKLLPNGDRLEIRETEFDRKSVVGRRTRVLSVMVVGKDGEGVEQKISEHGESPVNARTSSTRKHPWSLNRLPAVTTSPVSSPSPAAPLRPPVASSSIASPKTRASASSSDAATPPPSCRRPTTRSSTVSPKTQASASSSSVATPPPSSQRPVTRSVATSPSHSRDDSHITSSVQLTLEESTANLEADLYTLKELQRNPDETLTFAEKVTSLEIGEHLVIKESWPLSSRQDIEWDALQSCSGEFGVPTVVYKVTGKHPMPVECTQEARVPQHIALREKGTRLQDAESPRMLLTAVLHAVIGHWNFFQKRWLHRDVSIGNVLMLPEPVMKSPPTGIEGFEDLAECRGMLIDGDAMISSDPDRKLGDHRLCTLPFLSRRLVRAWGLGTKTFDQYFDDLESFAWVLLWALLEIAEANNRAKDLDQELMLQLNGTDLHALSAGKEYIVTNLKTLSEDIAQGQPKGDSTSLLDPFIVLLDQWFDLVKTKRRSNAVTLPSSEDSTLFYKAFITFVVEKMNELPETRTNTDWRQQPLFFVIRYHGANHHSAKAKAEVDTMRALAGASNMSEHTATSGASKYDLSPKSDGEVTESVETEENTVPPSELPLPLINEKCSGYFVQPLQWMSFLGQGEGAGKIACPNEKCGAKIGNYDWAGYHCDCGPWVTPGFCIHRSKVDEIIV